MCRTHSAQLRHGDGEIRKDFQQEGLELGVGLVDLVDEQERRRRTANRRQDRPRQEKALAEEQVFRPGNALCRLRQHTTKHLALSGVDERMRFQNAGQLRQLLAGAEQQAASADSRAGGFQFVDDSAHAAKGEIGGTLHALRD